MPTVLSTNPANGATGVATNTVVTIACSRPVDPNSLANMNSVMMSPAQSMTPSVDPNNSSQINISHPANYPNSTTITHTVTPFVLSTDEFQFTTYAFSFTTASAAPPPVAPTVVSVTPSNNATGVIPLAASISIKLVFSEAMDGTTINNTNITLKQTVAGTNAPCTVTLGGDNVTVTLVPNSDLLTNIQYTITATTAVKAAAGVGGLNMASTFTSKFTTEAAPTVSSFNPANNATGVAVTVAPTITFAQAMQPSSITTSTCNITGVTSSVSLDGTNKIVTITPNSNLANSTSYTINATTGCKQTDGVPLGSSASSSFTTIGSTPTVSSTNPANNATGVATGVNPTITFSIAMDSNTINATNIYITDPSNITLTSTVSLSGNGLTATITPSVSLNYSSTYTIHATTACKSTGGIALASTFTSTFTTTSPSYTLQYQYTGSNSSSAEYNSSSGDFHAGFGLQLYDTTAVNPNDSSHPLYGAVITKIVVNLKVINGSSNSLSGTITARIRNCPSNANGTKTTGIAATIGTVDASTITTTSTSYTFKNDANTYALAKYDCLYIEYPPTSSSGPMLHMDASSSGLWSHGGNNLMQFNSSNLEISIISGHTWTASIYTSP